MKHATRDEADLTRLYEGLARYNWGLRVASLKTRGDDARGLEMHKRLGPPLGEGPAAGVEALDAWLLDRLHLPERTQGARVLDVGCGFGATLIRWARRLPDATFVGLTLSPFQARKASEAADRAGVGARCTFLVQSFERDPEIEPRGPARGPFDAIVSIESLFHATDLCVVVASLARTLRPGGVIALVEDMAVDPETAHLPAAHTLLERWATARLHTIDDYRAALDRAGMFVADEVDLSAQVERGDERALASRAGRLRFLRRLAPIPVARAILDAYLGGIALEQLYGAERMRYRAVIARRPEGPA